MRSIFSLILFFIIAFGTNAQNHNITFSNLLFENGVNLGSVSNTVQDKTGKIWIASQYGLHFYDGKKLISYHPKSKSNPLSINRIQKIFIKGNILYIAERGSLKIKLFDVSSKTIIDSLDFKPVLPIPNKQDVYIQSFDITKKGEIWATSNIFPDGLSFIFHAPSKDSIRFVQELPLDDYPNIIVKGEEVFFGSDKKTIVKFSKNQLEEKFKIPSSSNIFFIDDLFLAEDQSVWTIGNCISETTGNLCGVEIFYHENGAKEFKQLDLPTISNIEDLYSIHKHGRYLFLGGELGQFFLWDFKTKVLTDLTEDLKTELKKSNNTVSRFHVNDIHRAEDGIYWISTTDGLVKLEFKPSLPYLRKSIYQYEDVTDEAYVYNLLPDNKKGLYLSHDEGVSYLDSFQNISIVSTETDHTSFPYSMVLDKNSLFYSEIKFDLTTQKSSLVIPVDQYGFAAPFKGQDGRIWIAKWVQDSDQLKLYIYNFKTQKAEELKIDNEDFSSAGRIYDCYQTSNDHLFFTTKSGIFELNQEGKILNHFNNQKDSPIQLPHSFSSTMVEDEYGTVWIGQGNGLTKINLKTKTSQSFPNTFLDGLEIERPRSIRSIISDLNGSLWLGTHQGLLRFDLKSKQFFEFPEFPELSLGEYRRTSVHRTNDGILIFGTTKGLIIFDPKILKNANAIEQAFPLNLRSYSKYDTKSKQTYTNYDNLESLKQITLSPYDINLRFEYFCPHYYSDQKILYSHFLKGLDSKWSPPSTKDELTFSQLKAGQYQLQIKALDIKNQQIGDTISVDIYVDQIWYKRWWVILLGVLILIGLVFIGLRYRFRKKLEKRLAIENLRTKISNDLHDDVGSILTGLAMQTEILQHTAPEKDKSKLSRISNLSRSAMSRMRDSVWAMDAEKDNWESLFDRMNEFASETLGTKSIHFTLTKEGLMGSKKIPGETRQNIYLIFKEAITNILKHSNATEVNISLKNVGAAFEMMIKDNGQVIKKDYKTTGQGTSSMKKRAELINGTISFFYKNGFTVLLRTSKI